MEKAAESGDEKAVMRMVDLGADLNSRDVGGYSPMELTVYRDDFRQMSEASLVKSGGGSLEQRLEKIAVRLVELGCDLGTEAQGRQLIWTATANGWHKFISALTLHPKIGQSCKGALGSELLMNKTPCWHGCPALWVAVQRGHVEAVKVLLKAGSKPRTVYKVVGYSISLSFVSHF